MQKLDGIYFEGLVDKTAGVEGSILPKPDSGMIKALLRELGSDAAHTLYAGDSEVDVRTAANAGLDMVAVLWGIDVFGRPRLGFLISGGNMDSMVNHYTVSKKRRSSDAYTAGGAVGKRPDHAVTVYGNLVRRKYKDVPVIIGGIEASLRRLAHYDYWSYIKRAGLRTCTTISFFRHTGSLKQTGLIMPAAFIRSTAIQTRIRAAALSSRILTGSILCRILRQSPCRSLRWTMCTDCLT